eukprot:GEMP01095622.1.p1 GENE.GEMP01095622.1~~GEMP01095622.1.p1  ORF type:complete len:194 (+),score=30.08 GEMP01095622.1:54-635(+)
MVRFLKNPKPKAYRSPQLYGWHHNIPWSKFNHFAHFQDKERPIRKSILGTCDRTYILSEASRLFRGYVPNQNRAFRVQEVLNQLNAPGPFTIFVPSNDALACVSESSWEKLDDLSLKRLLRKWSVQQAIQVSELVDGASFNSLAGTPLTVSVKGSWEDMALTGRRRELYVGRGRVLQSLRCWNGYLHMLADIP